MTDSAETTDVKQATNAMRIALSLKRNGVRYIFGQSNPPTVTLACSDIGIEQIGYRQENSGTYMAQAYAMCTNTIPVVTAQHGPAATLLVAGLAESLKASYPVVALVEEVSREEEEKNAFQEIDHLELFKGVAKWIKKIPIQERIEDYVDMAFKIAASGRPGPTVLLLPKDIITDTKEYPINETRSQNSGVFPLDRTTADSAKIDEAADLLREAKQPFIYAGGGVVSSGALNEIRELQEECSIPVATTTMGKGSVDEEHPLTMGPIGYYMGKRGVSKHLKPMVQEADVILLVGNRTNQNGTDSWTLLPKEAKYIHIDIDPVEIGRNYESLRLVGDAKLTLAALKESLLKKGVQKRTETRESVEKRIQLSREMHKEDMKEIYSAESGKIKVERFLYEVEKRLDDDHIVVADASISSVWNANYLKAIKDRKFIFPRGLAGLGWGLPMGMGAKIANPDKKVFCLVGDGGFGHVWSELETCKRLGIQVVVAVINNGILGYQKYAETAMFGRYTNICDFSFVDHTQIAAGCGIKGIKVDTIEDIPAALDEAFQSNETVVIDLLSDPNNIPPVGVMDAINN
ncbi:acetolactate synthase catalytic subunit [Siminovitchia fortis]|uniref:Acetolactate synthase catalytic subunit n=1 Tax=Siminovitchia fortis TaxID=254758 RepID=A0A443IWT8_9BACI|nr:acetolactate synthase catalytic subunit [Siminovitchia fortis]RWR12626.1 acetolactate synthase catalytic subunit [Siminovitchia fortis]WHY81426.1 acetolactate synthase catalytic subunit [Siminovitchia fortis]